jgi:hypothetical protein
MKNSLFRMWLVRAGMTAIVAVAVAGCSTTPEPESKSAELTRGWQRLPLEYVIQKPWDLKLEERYQFDPAADTHQFWVYHTDKPHQPPPNTTTARTEMRLATYNTGEHMFDADVNVSPNSFACIMQVFDAARGPVAMLIAHPDGRVTVGNSDVIKTNAIGSWWNLKVTNDPRPNGAIRIYVDNELVRSQPSRGARDYYFKCGVYSRRNSGRSEARFRDIKIWLNPASLQPAAGGVAAQR